MLAWEESFPVSWADVLNVLVSATKCTQIQIIYRIFSTLFISEWSTLCWKRNDLILIWERDVILARSTSWLFRSRSNQRAIIFVDKWLRRNQLTQLSILSSSAALLSRAWNAYVYSWNSELCVCACNFVTGSLQLNFQRIIQSQSDLAVDQSLIPHPKRLVWNATA